MKQTKAILRVLGVGWFIVAGISTPLGIALSALTYDYKTIRGNPFLVPILLFLILWGGPNLLVSYGILKKKWWGWTLGLALACLVVALGFLSYIAKGQQPSLILLYWVGGIILAAVGLALHRQGNQGSLTNDSPSSVPDSPRSRLH